MLSSRWTRRGVAGVGGRQVEVQVQAGGLWAPSGSLSQMSSIVHTGGIHTFRGDVDLSGFQERSPAYLVGWLGRLYQAWIARLVMHLGQGSYSAITRRACFGEAETNRTLRGKRSTGTADSWHNGLVHQCMKQSLLQLRLSLFQGGISYLKSARTTGRTGLIAGGCSTRPRTARLSAVT
jgi:hypothetical protein